MKENITPYLGNILPGLLNMASATAQASISTNPDSELDVQSLLQDDKKKINVMTSSIEDKEVGL
jgi:putative salt-induced outer membrane protein YdiY